MKTLAIFILLTILLFICSAILQDAATFRLSDLTTVQICISFLLAIYAFACSIVAIDGFRR